MKVKTHIAIAVLCMLFCLPANCQFKEGYMDYSSGKPVFRSDLTAATAEYLLDAEQYEKYVHGHNLSKAGKIVMISGGSVAIVSASVMFFSTGSLVFDTLKKETNNLKPKEKLAMTTFAASMTGCAATFVGLGLFVAGEVSLLKVANGYFKDHPYSEIKVAISPSSVGLTLGF